MRIKKDGGIHIGEINEKMFRSTVTPLCFKSHRGVTVKNIFFATSQLKVHPFQHISVNSIDVLCLYASCVNSDSDL